MFVTANESWKVLKEVSVVHNVHIWLTFCQNPSVTNLCDTTSLVNTGLPSSGRHITYLLYRQRCRKDCFQFGFTKDEALLLLCTVYSKVNVTSLSYLVDQSQHSYVEGSQSVTHVAPCSCSVATQGFQPFVPSAQQDHPFNCECPWLTEWVMVLLPLLSTVLSHSLPSCPAFSGTAGRHRSTYSTFSLPAIRANRLLSLYYMYLLLNEAEGQLCINTTGFKVSGFTLWNTV